MRDYGRVHCTFWSSLTIKAMSEDARTLALYLMTCPHGTIAGVFRLPDGYVGEDLGWTSERVREGFAELFAKGFANRCETTKWVWVIKHLEWNPPENPNQRKAALKCVLAVPDECGWKPEFMRVCGRSLGVEWDPRPNPSATVPEPFDNPSLTSNSNSSSKEEEISEAKASSSAKTPTVPCPYEQIVSLYHERLQDLPRVKLMPKARQAAIRKLWGWVLSSTKSDGERRATNADEALEWIGAYFGRAAENDFLMGRTPRSGEHAAWRCDLDFLLTDRGMRHVIERTQERAA